MFGKGVAILLGVFATASMAVPGLSPATPFQGRPAKQKHAGRSHRAPRHGPRNRIVRRHRHHRRRHRHHGRWHRVRSHPHERITRVHRHGTSPAAIAPAPIEPSGLPVGTPVPTWATGKDIHFTAPPQRPSSPQKTKPEMPGEKQTPTGPHTYTNCTEYGCVYGPLHFREGAPVQHEPKVHVIFWGSNWTNSGAGLRGQILNFYNGLSGSAYQGILTQYFDEEHRISSSVSVSSWTDTSVSAPSGVNDLEIREEVTAAINASGWTAELDAQFVVLPAPGTSYASGFGTEGGGFCAYHATTGTVVPAVNYAYSFIPYAGDEPFYSQCGASYNWEWNDANSITSALASHEYAEAATNPRVDNRPWTNSDGAEIADICSTSLSYYTLPNGSVAESLWDNNQNQCSTSDLSPPHQYAVTRPATINSNSEATLSAIVNPEGTATTYRFQYGTTASYGSNTPEVSAGSGTEAETVEQGISGLSANTTYHYRVVASSAAGSKYGEDHTFATKGSPAATTSAPLAVSGTNANLEGSVTPHGVATSYWFEYGTSTSYGTTVPVPAASAGAGTMSNSEYYELVGSLEPSHTYHFRIVAENEYGRANGGDVAFTTGAASAPTIKEEGVTYIAKTLAQLSGTVNPDNAETTYYIEYGTNGYSENKTAEHSIGDGTTDRSIYWNGISGLVSGESYYARITAVNAVGTRHGSGQYFFTTGESPRNTGLPEVSTDEPREGLAETTTKGTWVGKPSVAYEWRRCDALGEECVDIPGATKSSYFPVAADIGHALRAKVTATNSQGTTAASSAATAPVESARRPPVYALSFGSKGTGDGEVDEPRGIAVDPSGDVWVADTGNDRIQKFNSSGEYQCKIGAEGSGEGQFSDPRGIAADSEGSVWVADAGNDRLQEIGPDCEYLGQLGKAGSGEGGLSEPRDVALDPSGNLWVADSGNHRIEKFGSNGEYLASCGSKGTGDGQFEEAPLSVGTDVDGDVWAGDAAGRMEKFSPRCEYIAGFDEQSSSAPAKVQPVDFALDREGSIWIPSADAHDVQGFYPEGEYVSSFGAEEEALSDPVAIGAGQDGALWVLDDSEAEDHVTSWEPGEAYSVVTGQATAIKRTEATLTGQVDPGGEATSYQFEYGATPTFGTSVPASPKSVGSGTEAVAASQFLDGLKAETTYYYHLVATTEAGTTYGETRHFTTLPKPGSNAKWRIGGQTLGELGLEEAEFRLEGSLEINIDFGPSALEFGCEEGGRGELGAGGPLYEEVTLQCELAGSKPSCDVEPIEFKVNGSFESLKPSFVTIRSEGCAIDPIIELPEPTGSFEYGSEGETLSVTSSATTFYGGNPVTIAADSHWQLVGAQAGKAFGIENGPPEVFTEDASDVRDVEATLNGTINPLGSPGSYWFEYGPTAAYGTTVPAGGKDAGSGNSPVAESETVGGLSPSTTYHYRIVGVSGTGAKSYGKDKTTTTLDASYSDWRIEGSSLAELGAWEPYESQGAFDAEFESGTSQVAISCQAAGTGTLGLGETIALSGCETKLNGATAKRCAPADTSIDLDSGFKSEDPLVVFQTGTGLCAIGREVELKAGPGFTMQPGPEAVEFAAQMSETTETGAGASASVSIPSTMTLTGKYEGQKFAYAGDFESLDPNWRIEGSSLAELGAWEPYESQGAFDAEFESGTSQVAISCQTAGTGTLGFSETIALTECETKLNGSTSTRCAPADTSIDLDGELKSEDPLVVFQTGTGLCAIGREVELKAGPGFTMQPGPEAVEFAAQMSETTETGAGSSASVSISSTMTLTGKYEGSEFGYE